MIERARQPCDDVYDEPAMQEEAKKCCDAAQEAPRPRPVDGARQQIKPRILVDHVNPDVTVDQLRALFSRNGEFFDRGGPARIVQEQGGAVAKKMDADAIVLNAHRIARPYLIKMIDGARTEVDAALKKSVASMYLADQGNWGLPVLNGIASAPLLVDDGSMRCAAGYDQQSGFWLENVPEVASLIPLHPTLQHAEASLRLIRQTFRTFPFADAETIERPDGIALVDIDKAPGRDESAFLTMLLTAVCRPSLPLAPGALLTAAETSGAGTGKGKLARCIAAIAYGRQPAAVVAGSSVEELEKRLAAKLIESTPAILLDNVNGVALKSDLLASSLTEKPAEVRILGRTEMAKLNSSAFLIITGNGLRVSEDLARRFIEVRFDARTEDPEARPFRGDVVAEVLERRKELLVACLTIWRFGRQRDLIRGRALGGFEQWASWVRDPLLALGCKDPVERVAEAKANDPHRQKVAQVYDAWWEAHQDRPVTINHLNESVLKTIDPQNRGRQYVTSYVAKLEGTRLNEFMMTRENPSGKWGVSTYALKTAAGTHRGHRSHRGEPEPTPPMTPMPSSQWEKASGPMTLITWDESENGDAAAARYDRRATAG